MLTFFADVVVFHAGTIKVGNSVQTSGGRVIAVSAYASSLQGALDRAYEGVARVSFDGKVYRRDIAHQCVSSEPLAWRAPLTELFTKRAEASC
jgi:phosphoribosylamine--glycine ligase/phosphoribosylformylglycinamidine cyclo-ligase